MKRRAIPSRNLRDEAGATSAQITAGTTKTFTSPGQIAQEHYKTLTSKLALAAVRTHARRHPWTGEIASEEQ
jgi:hypothetical protein